jgi:hypothetical protein
LLGDAGGSLHRHSSFKRRRESRGITMSWQHPALPVTLFAVVASLLAACQTNQTAERTSFEPAAAAADAPSEAPRRTGRQQPEAAPRYYIEFRARDAQTYGHTYAMFGTLGANGAPQSKTIAGLHPASEDALPYTVGHFIPVPSETGPARGDGDDRYLLERFRIELTRERHDEIAARIRELQESSPTWHAVWYNCNAFVGDIARSMGLQTPSSSVILPQEYIRELRDLNANR